MDTRATGYAGPSKSSPPEGATNYQKLIVFGDTGFIGKGFIHSLKQRGIHFTAASSQLCDLTNFSSLDAFLNAAVNKNPDIPLRIVMLSAVGKFMDNTVKGFEENIRMIANLIRVLTHHKCASFVFASSTDVYGKPDILPLTENSKTAPVDWYGLGKTTSEQMLLMSSGLSPHVSILRLPGIFCLQPDSPSVADRLYHQVLQDKEIRLYHNGLTLRDYVSLWDLSLIMERLASGSKGTGILNIASGNPISMEDLVCRMGAVAGKQPVIRFEAGDPERKFDLVFDISKLIAFCPDLIPRPIQAYFKDKPFQLGGPPDYGHHEGRQPQ